MFTKIKSLKFDEYQKVEGDQIEAGSYIIYMVIRKNWNELFI